MTLKCTNSTCSYGSEFKQAVADGRQDPIGRVPEELREDSYSQQGNFDGLCLNCLDDDRRDREFFDEERDTLDFHEIMDASLAV